MDDEFGKAALRERDAVRIARRRKYYVIMTEAIPARRLRDDCPLGGLAAIIRAMAGPTRAHSLLLGA